MTMTSGQNYTQQRSRIMIVGVGNEHRGDDAVGILVARRLQQLRDDGIAVREESDGGLALLDVWQGVDTVVLIDAAYSGAPAGTIRRIDTDTQSLPATFSYGLSHAIGLADAIELGRVLCRLPSRLIIYGIEGKEFAFGAPVCKEVAHSIDTAVIQISQEVGHYQ
jgi:hydrogenase maturation protease